MPEHFQISSEITIAELGSDILLYHSSYNDTHVVENTAADIVSLINSKPSSVNDVYIYCNQKSLQPDVTKEVIQEHINQLQKSMIIECHP